MPGLAIDLGPAPTAASRSQAKGTTFFAVGLAERGSTKDPTVVVSMADFIAKLGAWVPYGFLYDSAQAYFGEGGVQMVVSRLAGPAATTGTRMLMDTAATPLATLAINALDAGAWSSRLSVAVAAGTVANTFRIDIYLDGTLTESFPDLASPAAAVTALLRSGYVRAVNQASVTAAPANNPAVLAVTALSTGTDDRASLLTADYLAGLTRFTPDFGSGAVAIPGQPASLVGTGLLSHARANYRIALTATAIATPSTGATSAVVPLRGALGSEGGALYWPWVVISDNAGGERTIPPEGTVAGVRARNITAVGPWQATAGKSGQANFVLRPEQTVDKATSDAMTDTNAINVILTRVGTTRIYGARSLSTDLVNYKLLTGREMLNYVASEVQRVLEDRVFGSIDARGFFAALVRADIVGILFPMVALRGLFELIDPVSKLQIDPGYSIDVGPGVNTPAVIAADSFKVVVGIRPPGTAALISVTINKAALTSPLAA